MLKTLFKIWLCLALVAWGWKHVNAHPDGATPFWYPSSYIYGFVNGCWQTVEQNEFLSKDMWPDEIKSVCGCVIDAIRHSIPFHEAEKRDPESNRKFDEITRGVLPVCISEQEESRRLRNKEH
jgi:hypothetical protein